jgi:hypothetical protein
MGPEVAVGTYNSPPSQWECHLHGAHSGPPRLRVPLLCIGAPAGQGSYASQERGIKGLNLIRNDSPLSFPHHLPRFSALANGAPMLGAAASSASAARMSLKARASTTGGGAWCLSAEVVSSADETRLSVLSFKPFFALCSSFAFCLLGDCLHPGLASPQVVRRVFS